jgi:uncharacterized membrane protein
MEELPGGRRVVFLPASPTPMSGNVFYVEAARVRALDITMRQAMQLVKRLGTGSASALQTVQLDTGSAA